MLQAINTLDFKEIGKARKIHLQTLVKKLQFLAWAEQKSDSFSVNVAG